MAMRAWPMAVEGGTKQSDVGHRALYHHYSSADRSGTARLPPDIISARRMAVVASKTMATAKCATE